jgi:hypothetical protein
MAFDSVFQGPPEDVAAPGTAQSPSLGVDVVNKELYVSAGEGWQELSSSGGETPGGSNGELQYNNSGAFAGTSGGSTNGNHFAFGDGSVIDTAATTAPDGEFATPAKAIACFQEETYTDPGLENGVYVEIDLAPSSPVAAGLAAVGEYVNVIADDSPNWNADDNFIIGSWQSANGAVNSPNVSPSLIGGAFGSYVYGSADIIAAHGTYFDAFHLGTGTVDDLVGAEVALQNASTGELTQTDGVRVMFYGGGAGGTTENYKALHVGSPLNNGDTITLVTGLQIDALETAGVGTAIPINSLSTSPSQFVGPIELPYTKAKVVYSAAGTPIIPAATAGVGARAFVSDATANVYGSAYTSGGSVKAPVYSDGTNWLMG